MITRGELGAVILAGGRGQRMGGAEDKAWVMLQGRPLITHVIERIQPQVGQLFVSANRDLDRYSTLGVTTVVDRWPDQRGPLAGIASVLAVITTPYLLIVPCDTPFLPADLAARLATALIANAADAAVAHSAGRAQPLCALARRTLAPALDAHVEAGGAKVMQWWAARHTVQVEFADARAFTNINTPADVGAAE